MDMMYIYVLLSLPTIVRMIAITVVSEGATVGQQVMFDKEEILEAAK